MDILGKEYETRLRITDPRVNHFTFYGELTEEDYQKILSTFPKAEIELNKKGKIISISVYDAWGLTTGFTIFNVNEKEKNKLIKKHDKENGKRIKHNRKKRIIY